MPTARFSGCLRRSGLCELPDMCPAVSTSSTPLCSGLNHYSRSLPTCSTSVSSGMTSSWIVKATSMIWTNDSEQEIGVSFVPSRIGPILSTQFLGVRKYRKNEAPFGLSVKAQSAPQGSGNSPEDRLPVFRPSSQSGLVACRPVIRIHPGPEGPVRHTQPYARRRVEKAGQTANSNRGSGGALAGGKAGIPTPSRQGPDRGRIGQDGDDPQSSATGCPFAEAGGNTRASRVAHRSRWPQDRVLAEPSAADGSATGAAGTMRSRARARGARTP